ncbi:hypothetical protein H8356DRAFT_74556 [Neocallimastix lanati (nom. inval.)]|jgi:uncharacterized membrane protein YidH (DUF202 family)|nr:hypothetical protein H8356DRAFT_74556 [Neocallimastix sp. JGI-2020a]
MQRQQMGMGGSSLNRSKSKQGGSQPAPSRVEPKVYFANERTFLSWTHTGILLAGLSLTILAFGNVVARIGGTLFSLVGIIFIAYAMIRYRWRVNMIKEKDPGPYDDRYGPYLLTGFLIPVVILNLYLSFRELNDKYCF